MICDHCKTGADRSTSARVAKALGHRETAELLNRQASIEHADCKGCECQHRITPLKDTK